MRKLTWLVLLLAGCAGPDADPLDVAERFHGLRAEGDDRAVHALLTDADRAAVPFEAFPGELPSALAFRLISGPAPLDSASLLGAERDTATVVLHASGQAPDTLRLVATHEVTRLWKLERDRVRWRVSMGLADWATLDSIATEFRAQGDTFSDRAVELARAYLDFAEHAPDVVRPADREAARATVRQATVAESLDIDLDVTESFMGTRLVTGRVVNPTGRRVATLRLIVQDDAGTEQRVDVWDIAPRSTAQVSELTSLEKGPISTRLERIQVY